MFVFTSGMHPGLALVFFFVGLVFVLYSFAGAFRWTCGWDRDEERLPRAAGRGDIDRMAEAWHCPYGRCRADNPPHAKFCRMCGCSRIESGPR